MDGMTPIRSTGKNIDPTKGSPFVFHASVSGFSILLLDILLDIRAYGEVDYIILHKKDVSLFYMTKKGYRQAYRLSKRLRDKRFFSKLASESIRLNNDLKSYKSPSLNEKNIFREWKRCLELLQLFCRIYRYHEQPFQQALEETVLKYVPEDALIELLSDSHKKQIRTDIDSKARDALDKLSKLGKMKLRLHLNAENLVAKDLMKFIEYAAKKNDLPVEIVQSLSVKEFTDLFNGKYVDINAAKARLNGCAMVKRNNKWYLDTGDRYFDVEKKIKATQDKEIAGNVAYPGKVKGKIVLHQSWTGITKLNEGEILVTGMTNPQMVPFIRKAGAIITDEGGITCHAAIISREMKIPCITGTKNATQLLGNGDLVEVDANKGIVKILKKAKWTGNKQ